MRAAASGSIAASRAWSAGRPAAAASASRRARSAGSRPGASTTPCRSARTYRPVPPATMGSFPRAAMSAIAASASAVNRAASMPSPGSTTSSR
jgi:hypothetical protein